MLNTKRAIAYLRSSSADEHGVRRQREAVRNWAERKGVEVVREFVDRGPATDRPALEALIAYLAEHPTVVLVTDPTRLSRCDGDDGLPVDAVLVVVLETRSPTEGNSNGNERTA